MGIFDQLGLVTRPVEPPPAESGNTVPPQHAQTDGIPPDPDFDGGDSSPVGVKHPCSECGNDVQYSGRGRVPSKCPDCRATRTRGGSTGAVRPPTPAGMSKRKAKIAGNMQEIAGLLGGSLGMAMPVTGGTIMYTSPPAIAGLLDIAEKYPRMMDALEKLTEVMPWYGVGRFVGAVAYAAAVDAGRVSPYGMVGEALGVAAVADQIGYQAPPDEPDDMDVPVPETPGMTIASPARFKMPEGV